MSEDVYRIQDHEGRGPFRPGFSHKWVEDREDHRNLLPWFIEMGPVNKHALIGEVCGSACETIDKLKRWFTPVEYETLKKYGYKSVKIEVDRIIANSNTQCFVGRSIPFNENVEEFELYG